MEKERIYYWDNLKAVLIFLVVLGHFLIPIFNDGRSLATVFFFIYIFHMPAFVFVSGHFAKYYMKKEVPNISKLLGFLILYMFFKILIWAVQSLLIGEPSYFDIFADGSAPWYLFGMFCWHVFLPLFDKFKAGASLGFALILGCIAGFEPGVGIFLCFSRCVVFLPFFLAGYYFKEDIIKKLTCSKARIASMVTLIAITVLIFLNLDFLKEYQSIIYGTSPYAPIPGTEIKALLLRIVWYVVAFIMTFAIMSLIPKRKLSVSYIGSRTLAIYVIHRLIREVFTDCDLYKYFSFSGISLLIFCIVISLALTVLLSWNKLSILFRKVFEINYDKLMKKENINN